MGPSSSLRSRISGLIHPDALPIPEVRAKQESFVLRRLSLSAAAIAAAPLYLAVHGAPAFLDAVVFLCLLAPLGAVVLLSVTGNLLAAEAVATFSLIAAGLTAAIGGVGEGPLAWLVLAPLDALFSLDPALIALSAAAALGAGALVACGVVGAAAATARAAGESSLFVVIAIAYASLTAIFFVREQARRSRAEEVRCGRLNALAEMMGDFVILHDRSGAAASVGRNCEERTGLSSAKLMGRGFFEHVHVADRPAFLRAIAEACAGEAAVNATLRLRTPGRAERGAGAEADHDPYAEPVFIWLDMRARRSSEPDGPSAVAVFRDITELKWRQDELEAARARAEEASLSKDNFLANMSHELRTPLNAIIGFSEILAHAEQAPSDQDVQREYAAIIHQSGHHLLAVVNSILDMSKIQSGSFELTPAHFSIAPLIDTCCDMVKLKAAERNIEIERCCPEEFEELVGDKRACKQILINLLSNAVKFTPANGKVSISARSDGHCLAILVADSGVGIDARDLARLGDPFFQAKGALDRPFEGTGLGLSIVSGLVGLHGGTIAVASEPDQGTCVLVRLPMDCRAAVGRARTSAKIDTIARYRRGEDQSDPFENLENLMVKKIA